MATLLLIIISVAESAVIPGQALVVALLCDCVTFLLGYLAGDWE